MNLRILSAALLAVIGCALWMAAAVSATSLTSPEGEIYTGNLVIESEGHAVLHNGIADIECASKFEGNIESHGEGVTPEGQVDLLSFTGCTNNWHVTVAAKGSFTIQDIGGDGTLISSGATVEATRFGVTCRYATNETHIGTFTSGSTAKLHIEAEIPFHSGSGLCGESATAWTASFEEKVLRYKSTSSPVAFHGALSPGQSTVWVTQGLKSTCTGAGAATYTSAAIATPAKAIKLEPTYTGCVNFEFTGLGTASKTETNECGFELLEPNVSLESNVGIKCKSGEKYIVLHGESFFSTCEVRIGEGGNTNLAKARYKNLGGTPSKFEAVFEVGGITAEVTKSTGFCGMTVGVIKNATYTGPVILEDKAGKAGVSVE